MLPDPPVLQTKIAVPVVKSGEVARPRLLEALDRAAAHRLTLLFAPAGAGKSTLLAQWTGGRREAIAWLTLDPMDNDPARLARYAAAALVRALPGRAGERIGALAALLPRMEMTSAIDALLHELGLLDQPLLFVVDDGHALTAPPVVEAVTYLIGHLPETVRLVLAGRGEPPFSASRWRVLGECARIDPASLRFTEPEAAAFYRLNGGLPPHQLRLLLDKTEGWAAGLRLAAEAMRDAEDAERLVAGFSGSHRDVADYMLHEVMASLPAALADFLSRTCVLLRFDAAACDAVAGRSDSARPLQQLLERGVYILPCGPEPGWYRVHQLLGEYLRDRLRLYDPALWRESHRRAAVSFAARSLLDEAIDHALAGADYALAEQLLQAHIAAVLQRGELLTLQRWLSCFPQPETLGERLSLLHAFVLLMTGHAEAAEQILARLERVSAELTGGARKRTLQSGLLFVKSNVVFHTGRFEEWIAYIGGLLDEELPQDPIFYNFNYNLSEPTVLRTDLSHRGALSPEMEQIAHLFSRTLAMHGWTDALIHLYVLQSLSEGYYEWNRLAESRELLARVGASPRLGEIPGLLVPHAIASARLYAAQARWDLALDTLEEAVRFLTPEHAPHWRRQLTACTVRVLLRAGRLDAARASAATLETDAADRPSLSREYEHLAWARVQLASGRPEQARRLLERLLPQAARRRSIVCLVEMQVLLTLCAWQQSHSREALAALQEALLGGAAHGYVRSFVDEGGPMRELLQAYAAQAASGRAADGASEEAARYARRLLGIWPNRARNAPAASAASVELIEALSPAELRMLRLIRQGASNRDIAATLLLSEGTVKVYLSRMYDKLGVSSRTRALVAAAELGLLESGDPPL
ncbi:LuxR family transcriptional regulator [Paenibacillus sp. IB182496]|uniref:LuxR family transcriptional regulator n=1 Tax=Paenibacillus sabuli TaxID=2772509 RepID=A0A927BRL4_9BACL|nr:LuxR C-terminal-related transcriptional regulator [Paenibacillus sabuli]MBD2845002.1 LuxR family transcriptional regulator [Paenibacillus sabuli]